MERKYDEAIEAFEETLMAITDTYYLEDCETEINSAANNLIKAGKEIDFQVKVLKEKVEQLTDELQAIEDYKKQLGNHVVIRIESLAMQNKIEEFIESELYSGTSFWDNRYEFIGSC